MSGTDKLLAKIIEEAKFDADKTIAAAREKVEEIKLAGRKRIETITNEGEEKASRLETDIVFRAKKNAELDAKKNDLAMRHEVIEKAFAQALEKMRSMDNTQSMEFLKMVLFKEVSGGEVIVPSEKYAHILAAVLPEINSMLEKENAKPVMLGEASRQIPDGFIIKGQGYLKTCTYEELLSDVREKHLGEIADTLF